MCRCLLPLPEVQIDAKGRFAVTAACASASLAEIVGAVRAACERVAGNAFEAGMADSDRPALHEEELGLIYLRCCGVVIEFAEDHSRNSIQLDPGSFVPPSEVAFSAPKVG